MEYICTKCGVEFKHNPVISVLKVGYYCSVKCFEDMVELKHSAGEPVVTPDKPMENQITSGTQRVRFAEQHQTSYLEQILEKHLNLLTRIVDSDILQLESLHDLVSNVKAIGKHMVRLEQILKSLEFDGKRIKVHCDHVYRENEEYYACVKCNHIGFMKKDNEFNRALEKMFREDNIFYTANEVEPAINKE